MKELEEKTPSIFEELKNAQVDLTTIWKRVLPLSTEKAYRIEDKTLSVLVSSELEKISDEHRVSQILDTDFSNPFHLTKKQHEAFVMALSVLKTLVDEIIIGFNPPWPDTYPIDWKPPQQRENVSYVLCNLHYINGQDWAITKEDIPVHFENHARILGRLTRDQEQEDIIELIPAGEARARSILEKLVKPFIASFNTVATFSAYMQKFCDKLVPVDETSCCIDARTRQAFDYALSEDLNIPTFTEFLNDAFNCCTEEQSNSYFYILAYLMRHHWHKNYKKDTGTHGICKTEGVLSSESYDLIIQGVEQTVLELNCTNDFLYAYDLIPKELTLEYLSLISEQEEYFTSLSFLVTDKDVKQFSKILKEQDAGLKYLSHILSQHLKSKNFVISSTLLKNIVNAVPQQFIAEIFSMNFKIARVNSEKLAEDLKELLPKLCPEEVSILFTRISQREIKEISLYHNLYLDAVLESIEKGQSLFFEFLLRVDTNLRSFNGYGFTPMMAAAVTGNIRGMKLLLESSWDIGLNAHLPENGMTTLHYAANYGHVEIVKLLLESPRCVRINHNALDKENQTPLYLAAEQGHAGIVKLLVDSGKVDLSSPQGFLYTLWPVRIAISNSESLHIAVYNSNIEVVEQLLKAGADPNRYLTRSRREGPHGRACIQRNPHTVLEIAAEAGNYAMVALLLKYNAKPYNKTPSHPNVNLAYIACCRRSSAQNREEFLDYFERFMKMDAKIDQLLKKSEFYASISAPVKLYQLYDDYLAEVDISVINEKLEDIENTINKMHAKTAGLRCPAIRGSRVYFADAEELRFSTKIVRKGNQAFFQLDVLSREEAYERATAPSKEIIREGNVSHFRDIT